MISSNNIYIGNDPLFTPVDYNSKLPEIEKMEQALSQKMAQLRQFRQQVEQSSPSSQPQQSNTPVWDEIDAVTQSMSDKEFEMVTRNEEWIESNSRISSLIQSAQLRMLRPMIEGSKEGREALEHHLTITKRIKKSASKEMEDELSDFQEYREKYSNMTYDEYRSMKRDAKTKKR